MPETDFFKNSRFVNSLKPSDFDSNEPWKLIKHRCSIVMFYCHWCPHCQKMKETWESLGEVAAFFDVCAFDCEGNKGHLEKIRGSVPDLVVSYPTIIIYEKGIPIETFKGERTQPNLIQACMRACKGRD